MCLKQIVTSEKIVNTIDRVDLQAIEPMHSMHFSNTKISGLMGPPILGPALGFNCFTRALQTDGLTD